MSDKEIAFRADLVKLLAKHGARLEVINHYGYDPDDVYFEIPGEDCRIDFADLAQELKNERLRVERQKILDAVKG